MKKKIALLCLVVFVFCLLPGCTADMPDATEDTTGAAQETSSSNVLDATEQKDIYFATGNDYYDLYVGYSWVPGPEIRLFSREHIDPDSIQVTVDIQADYAVYVHEQETGKSLTSYAIVESEGKREAHLLSTTIHDLPLYLYQTYAGMDWKAVGQKHTEYMDVMEQYTAGEVGEDQVCLW